MPLVRLNAISHAFGTDAILDAASLQIDAGEHIGLIGRNGEGKSTLLRIIQGELSPDHGEVWRQPELKCAFVPQRPACMATMTVFDAVASKLGELGELISRHHHLTARPDDRRGPQALEQLARLQTRIDIADGWRQRRRIDALLQRLGLPGEKPVAKLSGGWQRRVELAGALVRDPELLLLDEPTNHLDLDAISWLEDNLAAFPGALVFVTHDRAFLQKLARRIVDLDRGRLVSWPGAYMDYVRRKAAAVAQENKRYGEFDKKLAAEETWIRQGIKARRTRNEGRVRALKKLREQRMARRTRPGRAGMVIEEAERSGKLVIEALGVNISVDGNAIIRDFSTTILRGDRIGLIGPNGIGKTTLLRLLSAQQAPDSGVVRHGTRLEAAYFDQLRAALDPEKSVAEWVGDGREFITFEGRRRHVISHLQDFLFVPSRTRSPISSLSGGEQNRVLLARLFSRPVNLLILDEPTNDLDIETLELLEELLLNFDGTILLVSHDRAFLDNVVTSTLVFEGDGRICEYPGSYSDWERQRCAIADALKVKADKSERRVPRARKKLSFSEQRELDALPARIAEMEEQQDAFNRRLASHELYRADKAEITQVVTGLKALETDLERCYRRWEALESLAEATASDS